jgi:uncharacterized membrane protein YdfJ with MMPL/SSD domain
VLPPGDSARAVQDALRDDFTSREASPLEVVMSGIDPSRRGAEIGIYAAALSQVPGVARVDAATGSYAGLTLAVLVDAFVIRATLVPAFMTLAGNANWWAPRWLRRVHARIGISDHVELDDDQLEPPTGDEPLVGAGSKT